MEVVWFVVAVAVCVGMYVVAARMEPHWVAKDSSRFLTTAQPMDRLGKVIGRRREVRAAFLPDGALYITRRSLVGRPGGRWRVQAKSPRPPRGKEVYLLTTEPAHPQGELLALRVPASSKVVPLLDRIAPGVGDQRSDT